MMGRTHRFQHNSPHSPSMCVVCEKQANKYKQILLGFTCQAQMRIAQLRRSRTSILLMRCLVFLLCGLCLSSGLNIHGSETLSPHVDQECDHSSLVLKKQKSSLDSDERAILQHITSALGKDPTADTLASVYTVSVLSDKAHVLCQLNS
jgi:predicted nucleic acid-binding Zn ribbon protein